jgi:hypothetical protein
MAKTPSLNISRRPISLSSAWLDIERLLLLRRSNPIVDKLSTTLLRSSVTGSAAADGDFGWLFAHRAVSLTSNAHDRGKTSGRLARRGAAASIGHRADSPH